MHCDVVAYNRELLNLFRVLNYALKANLETDCGTDFLEHVYKIASALRYKVALKASAE